MPGTELQICLEHLNVGIEASTAGSLAMVTSCGKVEDRAPWVQHLVDQTRGEAVAAADAIDDADLAVWNDGLLSPFV